MQVKKREKITYSTDKSNLTFIDLRKCAELAEKYFGTERDPEQMPTDEQTSRWIINHIPDCVNAINKNEEIIGFIFIIPCNKILMNKFLSRAINEAQLWREITKTVNYDNFTAIYLCSAFVKPEYRRKGLAAKAIIKSIKKITKNKKIFPSLFFEAYSEEGKACAKTLAEKLKIKISERV